MDNKENAINMRRVNTPSVPPPQLTKTPIKVFGTGDDGHSPKLASTSKDSKNKTSTPVMLDVQTNLNEGSSKRVLEIVQFIYNIFYFVY